MKHDAVLLPTDPTFILTRACVPASLMEKVEAEADFEGSLLVDILVENGYISRVSAAGKSPAPAVPAIDLEGRMVWPTLVDMHTHLDKGEVIPRVEPDGTLNGGAMKTWEDRKTWTYDDIRRRMDFGLRCAYVHGVSAIRTHLDSGDEIAKVSWRVFQDLREEWKGRIALQACGLAGLDVWMGERGEQLANLVAAAGGILGNVTDALGAYQGATKETIGRLLDRYLELAAERNLDVDLHVDQSADLNAFFLPDVAQAVLRTKFRGKVVVDHCVNLALQPEAVAKETIALCAEAGISFVTLPTPMMYLMDRTPGRTPRWRGVTLTHEIRAAGIPIALGGDNCRDAWYPYGDHDMVDIFRRGVHTFQLDHPIAKAPAMVGPIPADIIGEKQAGLVAAGREARLILFRARSINEVMSRPQSDRIVLDRGRRVTDPLPDYSELDA